MAEPQTFSLSRLTPSAQQAFTMAMRQSSDLRHAELGAPMLMYAFFQRDDAGLSGSAVSDLVKAGLDINSWGQQLEAMIQGSRLSNGPTARNAPMVSPDVGRVLQTAQEYAGASLIGAREIWAATFTIPELAKVYDRAGLTAAKRSEVLNTWGLKKAATATEDDNSFVAKYCKNLTTLAENGQLDPVIGRDEEIREAMNILQRRTKNNPIFVGEPGVGKTALVEGLAQRMSKNEVPETLKNKVLLSLDLGSLIAGAKYKGELEERVKGLVKEIQERSDVVLFIDEIHTLVNANGEAGGVGQLLKPALARGELRCIGATTPDEYRQYLEKDPALERRFQKILVQEPSLDDAVAILRGIKDKYALHHGVDITDSAIVAAVQLSSRYITDRQLPDKAIDLMDTAAARVRTVLDSKPDVLDRLDRKLIQLKVERETIRKEKDNSELDDDTQQRLAKIETSIQDVEKESLEWEQRWSQERALHDNVLKLQEELATCHQDLERAQRDQNLGKIGELQYGAIPAIEASLRQAKKQARSIPDALMQDQVTADQIADVVSRRTGIPVSKMKGGEQQKLATMEEALGAKVIGQEEAVEAVSDAVRRSRSGLSDPNRPIGSFLFLGPTGVGKTELTKVLASFLFDRKDAMVRIDMSEFMEKHSVSRLIGAPPGYVGYEEGGVLTEAIRQHPYAVILLDEVEKAHPDVFNVLLQVLDDGHLTDGQGRTVDFKNTVIIMTSNLGAADIQELTAQNASQDEIKGSVMNNVKKFFRPEFINRLDETVIFKPLDRPAIKAIARLQVASMVRRLAERKVDAVVSDAAIEHLAESGFDVLMGARPLRRAIQQELENPLAKQIVSGQIGSGDVLEIDATGGQLSWNVTKPTPDAVDPDDEITVAPVTAKTVTDNLSARRSSSSKKATAKPK